MRSLRYPVLLFCMGLAACAPPSPVSGSSSTTITIQGEAHILTSDSRHFWDEPVYNVSNTVAYVIRNRGDSRGYEAESIAKVTKGRVIDPVVATCTTPQGTILKIYGVSDDGERLLVELHFVKRKSGASTDYGTRPVILDIKKGALNEVGF